MDMKAVIIDNFGDENEFKIRFVPIPSLDKDQVLIKLEYAGVGSWDVFEREGGYSRMLDIVPAFPYVLGSEGCGRIVKIGENVSRFKSGDTVAAAGFLNPKGGFYAEYVAVDERFVTHIPSFFDVREASVVLGVGITALRGLVYILNIQKNERVCILGASGGIGHLAVQMAHRLGAQVYAVATGKDGVSLIKTYGVNKICDGSSKNIVSILDEMEFTQFDKALILASSQLGDEICRRVKPKGVVAYPSGIFPEPTCHKNIKKYNGDPDADIIGHLIEMIEEYKIRPHISREYLLTEVSKAHRLITAHHLGKFSLKIN